MLSRYSGFFRNLLKSPSREDRILSRIVASLPRSTADWSHPVDVQFHLDQSKSAREEVPDCEQTEKWRLSLLTNCSR